MSSSPVLPIGELARRSGISVRALRHYDDLGLLSPSGRTSNGHRRYTSGDLARLLAIQHLKSLGLGLSQIKAALDEPGFSAHQALADHLQRARAELRRWQDLAGLLEQLQGATDHSWDDVLQVVALSDQLSHGDFYPRVAAALQVHSAAAVPTLADHLLSDADPGVREVLSWAISQHPEQAREILIARLAGAEADEREQIARTLGKLGGPAAVDALMRLLTDPDPTVAAVAVMGLGHCADPLALPQLIELLGASTVPDEIVTGTIGSFGEEAVEFLVGLSADASPRVRELTAESLGLTGVERALAPLASLIDDPAPEVRFAAVLAVGGLPGAAATRMLREVDAQRDRQLGVLLARLLNDRGQDQRHF